MPDLQTCLFGIITTNAVYCITVLVFTTFKNVQRIRHQSRDVSKSVSKTALGD